MTLTAKFLRSLLQGLKDDAKIEILIPTDPKGESHIFALPDEVKIVKDEVGKWDDLNVWIYLREFEVDIAMRGWLKKAEEAK